VADSTIANVLPAGGNLAWLNALTVTPLLNPTTVSATYKTLVTTTRLTVDAPTLQSITISPASLDLTAGTSSRFTVTGNFSGGTSQDVTYNTTWTSDSSGIAAVGTTGTNKGRVNGVSSGTTGINAAYGGLTVTAPVTVTARTIDTLTVSGATLLTSGNQVKFTASALYTDLTRTDVTEDAVWSLSVDKPYVAILADSAIQPGQVVGVDTGSSALTAIFNGKTVSATVTVP
jgi:alanine dehydrogenase